MRAILHDHDGGLDGINCTAAGLQSRITRAQGSCEVTARAFPFLRRHVVFRHEATATMDSQRNFRHLPLRSGAGAIGLLNTALLYNARSA